MMPTLLAIIGLLLGGLILIVALFVGGMRAKWPPVVNRVRRMNRRFMNPSQMGTAGQPGAYADILRHTGRRTGVTHETPLGIVPYKDGFIIAMVYGSRADWARNVLASGVAEVVVEGFTYQVDRPRVVSRGAVVEAFSTSDRFYQRVLAIDEYLLLGIVGEPVATKAALDSGHD